MDTLVTINYALRRHDPIPFFYGLSKEIPLCLPTRFLGHKGFYNSGASWLDIWSGHSGSLYISNHKFVGYLFLHDLALTSKNETHSIPSSTD
jgi:hypothetical protein